MMYVVSDELIGDVMFVEQLSRVQGYRIRLRCTTESDLDAVLRLEQDEENRAYIIPWTYERPVPIQTSLM